MEQEPRSGALATGLTKPGLLVGAVLAVATLAVVLALTLVEAEEGPTTGAGSPTACLNASITGTIDGGGGDVVSVTDGGNIITRICIKTGQGVFPVENPTGKTGCANVETDAGPPPRSSHSPCIDSNGQFADGPCYAVSGMGTAKVTVSRKPATCPPGTGISHVDFVSDPGVTETFTPTPTDTATATATPEDPKSTVLDCVAEKLDLTPATCKFDQGQALTVGGTALFGLDMNGDNIAGWQRGNILVTWPAGLDPQKNSAIVCPAGSAPKVKVAGPGAWADGCVGQVQGLSSGQIDFFVTLNCTNAGTFTVDVLADFTREDGTDVPPDQSISNEASVDVTCNPPTLTPTPTPTDTPTITPTPTAFKPGSVPLGGGGVFPDVPGTGGSSGADYGIVAGVLTAVTAGAIALGYVAWYARRRLAA